MPPLLRNADAEATAEFMKASAFVEGRLWELESLIRSVHRDVTHIKEKLNMVDPIVQKIADDTAAIKTAVDAVVVALNAASAQVSTLQGQISSASMSAEDKAALAAAASSLEATIGEAKNAAAPVAPTASAVASSAQAVPPAAPPPPASPTPDAPSATTTTSP